MHETEIRIAPEISARLASIAVKSGQEARKGEVLAALSSPEVAASLEEAKANLESARANLANVIAGVRQEERDTAAQNVAIAELQRHAGEAAVRARLGAGGEELREPAAI